LQQRREALLHHQFQIINNDACFNLHRIDLTTMRIGFDRDVDILFLKDYHQLIFDVMKTQTPTPE
jgi:hypothetical protein